MILLIDNYDSFTYNLAQLFGELGEEVTVVRNNRIKIPEINEIQPSSIIISPGPGTPQNAGISCKLISAFADKIPLLGVCLGHQCIAEVFGGRVVRTEKVVHGKASNIYHDSTSIYSNIDNPFVAARYHSLIVERCSLPECFNISAWTKSGKIMGIKHKIFNIEGIQFHVESILTKRGKYIIKNFLKLYASSKKCK